MSQGRTVSVLPFYTMGNQRTDFSQSQKSPSKPVAELGLEHVLSPKPEPYPAHHTGSLEDILTIMLQYISQQLTYSLG